MPLIDRPIKKWDILEFRGDNFCKFAFIFFILVELFQTTTLIPPQKVQIGEGGGGRIFSVFTVQ